MIDRQIRQQLELEFKRTEQLKKEGYINKDFAEGRKCGLNVAHIILFKKGLGKEHHQKQGII